MQSKVEFLGAMPSPRNVEASIPIALANDLKMSHMIVFLTSLIR